MTGFEFKEFEKYEKRINNLNNKQLERLNRRVINRIAGEYLEDVRPLTPVGDYGDNNRGKVGGTLRRGWEIEGRAKRNARGYYIDVVNETDYASYVNFGHRTRNGGWVEGKFFAEKAEEQTNRHIQGPIKKIVETELRRALDAD